MVNEQENFPFLGKQDELESKETDKQKARRIFLSTAVHYIHEMQEAVAGISRGHYQGTGSGKRIFVHVLDPATDCSYEYFFISPVAFDNWAKQYHNARKGLLFLDEYVKENCLDGKVNGVSDWPKNLLRLKIE